MSVTTAIAYFDIARDGTLVYAPGFVEGGKRRVVLVDRRGVAVPLPLPDRNYLHPRLSPDERQLALEVEGPAHDLFAYDLERGSLTKLTFDGASHWPLWTPQGDRITFRSMQTGAMTMWWMPADRSGPAERLTNKGKWQSGVSWTPDGKALAFITGENPETSPDVYVLPLQPERTPRPFAQSRFAEGSPKFSPDGRWLAYCSNESGRPEVYVQPWPGPGPKMQISNEGGSDPLWSRKSGELFYRSGDKIMACKVTTAERFSATRPQLLWQGHYSHGRSTSCGRPGPTSSNYDVTADGRRFVMIEDKDQDIAPLTRLNVVLNWTEELKRLERERQPD